MQFQKSIFRLINSSLKFTVPEFRAFSTAYRSSVSLNNLYPGSSSNPLTPAKVPEDPSKKFSGFIPLDNLDITYSRSSGPGGQHVNMVNTKVDVRFHLESANWLSDEAKEKLANMYKNSLNKDGYFIVRSEKTRSQIYNQADAITILRERIFSAYEASEPRKQSTETLHMLRKRKERANFERLVKKKMHSLKKDSRQSPSF